MKISNSRVNFVQNNKIPTPLYYALYRWTPHGYYREFRYRNLPKDELLTYVSGHPGTYRAYPRLTENVHPTPRYLLVCRLSNGHETRYKSVNWKYICRQFDRGINMYSTMLIYDLHSNKLLVCRDADSSLVVSNKVTMPKHRPEPRYRVTVTCPDGHKVHSYTYAWKYAKRIFSKTVKVCDKVDIVDIRTAEVYMYRNGTDWYFAQAVATLQ